MENKRNIKHSIGFSPKETQGYFMISNQDSATAILNKLTGAQFRLWHYLMMIDCFADYTSDHEKIYHEIPTPADIALKIGSSVERVEKDIRVLRKLGLYDYRITVWEGHNLTAAKAKAESERLKKQKTEKTMAKTQTAVSLSQISPPDGQISPPDGQISPPDGQISPQKSLNSLFCEPKTAPEKASGTPQTIQTYSDFKQTLSEPEREKFLNFVREKVKHFPNPINDLEGWLAKKNEAGIYRWRVYYEVFQREVYNQKEPIGVIDWQKHPKYDEWIKHVASCPMGFMCKDQQEGFDGLVIFGTPEDRAERKAFAKWALANRELWRNK
jgi:hypothetical protein